MLGPLEAEMAGDLLSEGTVLGSQAGVLSAGGIEPLAADEVADLVLAVKPSRETPADCATVLKLTACPWRCSSWMAWWAADSAAWWRRALAWAR